MHKKQQHKNKTILLLKNKHVSVVMVTPFSYYLIYLQTVSILHLCLAWKAWLNLNVMRGTRHRDMEDLILAVSVWIYIYNAKLSHVTKSRFFFLHDWFCSIRIYCTFSTLISEGRIRVWRSVAELGQGGLWECVYFKAFPLLIAWHLKVAYL